MVAFAMTSLHWISCGYVPGDDTWVSLNGFTLDDVGELYVAAFYWAVQTVATVGYGTWAVRPQRVLSCVACDHLPPLGASCNNSSNFQRSH